MEKSAVGVHMNCPEEARATALNSGLSKDLRKRASENVATNAKLMVEKFERVD